MMNVLKQCQKEILDFPEEFINDRVRTNRYKFFVCNLATHDFFESDFKGPLVIAVRQR